ncbi:MAG: metal-dependent hydrolase [Thermoplasmata archaeon]|nr:metal-dependent hydrolase [Thermoplasmata archaeon]
MKRTTHLLSGMAIGALTASLLGEQPLFLLLLGGAVGTAPDLDIVLARAGLRVHRCVVSHSLLAAALFSAAWLAMLSAISEFWGSLAPSVPLWPSVAVVFLSAFMHAAEDSMTRAGCKLFYPFSRRVFRGPIRYDDLVTNASVSAVALLVVLVSLANDLSQAVS